MRRSQVANKDNNSMFNTQSINQQELTQSKDRAVDTSKNTMNQDSNSKQTLVSSYKKESNGQQERYQDEQYMPKVLSQNPRKSDYIQYIDLQGNKSVISRQEYEDMNGQSRLSEQARNL